MVEPRLSGATRSHKAGLGQLRLGAERLGTVAQIATFLQDLDAAYTSLYAFQLQIPARDPRRARRTFAGTALPSPEMLKPSAVRPDHRLSIESVVIESPGFWEFAGTLSPLQQLREYLNDRHRRRQDRTFRDAAERDRLALENDLIQAAVWEKHNAVFRERIALLRSVGYTDQQVRAAIWAALGPPLSQLGRHQDDGLITTAEISSDTGLNEE